MNLAGKIFTVLILVMSIVFMAFAMAVYATHKNWAEVVDNAKASADKPLGLSQQLKSEQTRNAELNAEIEALRQQYEKERAAKDQAIAKLAIALEAAKAELVDMEKAKADLEAAEQASVAAMTTTQANSDVLLKKQDAVRAEVVQAEKDRETHFREVVRLTDALNQAINDRDQLRKRTEDLGKDVNRADAVLQKLK